MNSNQKNSINNNIKDKKEILNNLLKQLIDQKLTRLEKRNITEIKTFQTLSGETQDLILSLENMSQSARKEICIQRQKYLNSQNKSTKTNNSKSKIKKPPALSPKTLPKSISTIKFSKIKRIDSKSYDKYNPLHTDISSRYNKSQIIGTAKSKSRSKLIPKTNDNKKITNIYSGRKTEGNASNNFNKTMIPYSKVGRKSSPFIPSQDKLNKTMGRGSGSGTSLNQRRTSAQKKKSVGKVDNLSKTERTTKKSASKFMNNNNTSKNKDNKKEKPKTTVKNEKNNLNNISTLEKIESNNLDDSRLKILDVFNESKKGMNNTNNNLNINMEIKNKDKDKKDNQTGFLSTLSKQFEKVGTIKVDDKLISDSLLVTNNLEGSVSVNVGDLIRDSTIKELNNPNTPNNNLQPNNNNLNKKGTLNSSVLIYNKLKRTKITFLEGEHDFDLIFKDSKIMDMDLNLNLNKDNDLNTTELSDQMSLEEKFESNLDIISRYLDMRDICNVMLVNKECFKTLINILVSKTEISIELLEEEINKLKVINSNINFNNARKKPFKLGVNSIRAISLLNSSSGNNILSLNVDQLNKKEIILIYSLYFVAIGKKKDILNLEDLKKVEYMQNYFKDNCLGNNNFGKLIEKQLNGIIMDDNIISTLYTLSKNKLDIISPNYFQRINKDIAIFVFVIKDLLEQIGLLGSKYLKPDLEFILLNARLQSNKAILKELNLIEENIY